MDELQCTSTVYICRHFSLASLAPLRQVVSQEIEAVDVYTRASNVGIARYTLQHA